MACHTRAILPDHPNGICATTDGTSDWKDEVKNEPFDDRTLFDAAVLVSAGGKWIFLDKTYNQNQVKTHIFDPNTLSWMPGDVIPNIKLGKQWSGQLPGSWQTLQRTIHPFPRCLQAARETESELSKLACSCLCVFYRRRR